jgi:ADP-ribose pyrophosphatase
MSDPTSSLEVLGEGKWLRLVRRGRWEFAQRTHSEHSASAACIVAVTDAGEMVLVEQFRAALGCTTIELPAGLIGDQEGAGEESSSQAALRELEEETGFTARRLEKLDRGCISAGLTDEQLVLFRAHGLERIGPGGGDETENITVQLVPIDALPEWLAACQRRGAVVDLKIYAGLHFAGRSR